MIEREAIRLEGDVAGMGRSKRKQTDQNILCEGKKKLLSIKGGKWFHTLNRKFIELLLPLQANGKLIFNQRHGILQNSWDNMEKTIP